MEASHLFLLAALLMLWAAPLLLMAYSRLRQPAPSPAPHEIPLTGQELEDAGSPARRRFNPGAERLDAWRYFRQENPQLARIAHQLRLAGAVTSAEQVKYLLIGVGIAVFLGITTLTTLLIRGGELTQSVVYALLIVGGLLLLEYSALKSYAQRRQKRIEEESMMLIQTLRMLWRVGLSLPKTLSILCDELRTLTPESARELRALSQRIEAGQSQDEALYQLADNTEAGGFRELLIILRQESMTGGGIDHSLQELYGVLQSMRKTEMQEKVSKTSGKMSLVMMLFLFPALIIVVGGPGFIAIGKALGSISGG